MTLGSYGIGLELCFLVNAVFTLWGGLYRNIVMRQEVLSGGAASLDRVLAHENHETIAFRKLRKTIDNGVLIRQVLWYAARGAGMLASTVIYVAAVSFADVQLPDAIAIGNEIVVGWPLVEALFAYLSPSLVIVMAGVSLIFERRAKSQLDELHLAADELETGYANVRQDLPE